MTQEERLKINEYIDKLIGTDAEQKRLMEGMSLAERTNSYTEYKKMRAHLFKIAEKEGIETLSKIFVGGGGWREAVTRSGKKAIWERNNGYTARTRYCGSLWIEGVGTVFTSGTIAKAVEYLLRN